MAVAPHQDRDPRPVPADAGNHMLQDRAHFDPARRLAAAQDHGHRLADRPFIDVDRQKAALIVMRVEQRQLLMAMHRVAGVVDVENDRLGRPVVTGAELIHHRAHQTGDLDPRRRVLEPRHGRLRAQRPAALRRPAHRHLEDRILPQLVAVVGILVARRDREHPQPQHLLDRVIDAVGIAAVVEARRQARRDLEPPLHAPQQQHARVRRQHPAVEANAHLLPRNRWKLEGQQFIVIHGGCGAPRSLARDCSTIRIMR